MCFIKVSETKTTNVHSPVVHYQVWLNDATLRLSKKLANDRVRRNGTKKLTGTNREVTSTIGTGQLQLD
ncbi:hypothetical protein KDA_50670 [Dictyobacter alpinus]|uniref:Uncharacterized protein n=1 Tax=Dictyobacter alpinus TaxID=2014873 RepID=A0A402BDW7_9CHLR|nr:hypothetical protein KDA_50670 [Dictyobacter alpinus]